MSDAVLEARNVSKEFPGARAVDSVDLVVRAGETMVLIGASGSGKTTLLRMFNRLVEPTRGEIRLDGRPARELDGIELRRRTGYVQQEGGLLPHWTAGRNVGLVTELLGWEPERRRQRVDELLELVGLAPERYRRRYPRQLSGGERQRVAVARALAADPPVILLDEPFGALDALTRQEMQDEFRRLQGRLQKTMVLVTHDLDEAFRLGDRIAVMRDGQVLQVADGEELRRRPADDYVRALIARARRHDTSAGLN